MAWSEAEAKAAVQEYFKLLKAEQNGQPTNKPKYLDQAIQKPSGMSAGKITTARDSSLFR